MKNKLCSFGVLLTIFVSSHAMASPQIWKESESNQPATQPNSALSKSVLAPLKVRTLALNMPALVDQLDINSTSAAKLKGATNIQAVIDIPLPEGEQVRVRVKKTSIMAPDLAKQFPDIRSWNVIGEDDASIYGVIDITEHGFHAMLVMPDGDTVFIDPDRNSDKYFSFSKQLNAEHFHSGFQCKVNHQAHNTAQQNYSSLGKSFAKSALNNITYRMAVATTGEYTQYYGGVSGALGAVHTTINRINAIYQRDLGIQFQLVAEQASIIYTNPNSDPYTNNSLSALKLENVNNLDRFNVLGSSRFDIGHVFAKAHLGGLANYAAVCDDDRKAGGASGLSNPEGEAFSVDIVAHEIGHQLGALHTFNSACGTDQRTGVTAVEPGSGSTIMSYAGECSPNNLQPAVDAQFHAVSIIQMMSFSRTGEGSQCGSEQGPSNQDPQVNAGSDYTIPAQTPFFLVASGSDSDNDTLSYTWEQADAGTESHVDIDTGDNALIRSRPANISATRYVPRLSDLFRGAAVRGERLPVTDRDMSFMVTIRDGKGGVDIDDMTLSISGTGRSFTVTSHRFEDTLFAGDDITVTWDVAGTNSSPISCDFVDISFIESDGTKQSLVTTENDGRASFTISTNVPTINDARLMLACNDNRFFNLSRGQLSIVNEGFTSSSSGGGSISFFLMPLILIGLLRRKSRGLKS